MRIILFLVYYCLLRLSVLIGLHETFSPLDIGWQWSFWLNRYRRDQPLKL